MAVDMFLKIEGIPGESKDDAHKDEIDIYRWDLGMEQTGTAARGGGLGAGRVGFQDLNVEKRLDASTHALMLACAKGTHIPEAKLTVRKAGDTPLEYMIVTMRDCLVSSVQHHIGDEETQVVEQMTLNFSQLEVAYVEQKADGSGEAPKEFKWDIKANKQL